MQSAAHIDYSHDRHIAPSVEVKRTDSLMRKGSGACSSPCFYSHPRIAANGHWKRSFPPLFPLLHCYRVSGSIDVHIGTKEDSMSDSHFGTIEYRRHDIEIGISLEFDVGPVVAEEQSQSQIAVLAALLGNHLTSRMVAR